MARKRDSCVRSSSSPPPAKRRRYRSSPSSSERSCDDRRQDRRENVGPVLPLEDRDGMYNRLLGTCGDGGGGRTLNPRQIELAFLSAARAVSANARLGSEIVREINRRGSIGSSSGRSSSSDREEDVDARPGRMSLDRDYFPEIEEQQQQQLHIQQHRHDYEERARRSSVVRQESEALTHLQMLLPPESRYNLALSRVQGQQHQQQQRAAQPARVSIFQRLSFTPQQRTRQVRLEGMIFGCTNSTRWECDARGLFGLPSRYMPQVELVRPGTVLFLFNYENKLLSGVYEATSNGAMDIVPEAFRRYGYFPAQVEVCRRRSYPDIPFHVFKRLVHENFYNDRHFYHVLRYSQVDRLLSAFEGYDP